MEQNKSLRVLLLLKLLLLLLTCSTAPVSAENIRAIFLFKDVLKSNTTALKTAGFNTLIIFGLGILENGDIKYYSNTPGSQDIVVASGGVYVGGSSLAEKVRSFKTTPENNTVAASGVNRVEISMNSIHVKNLMSRPGPGPETPLYRNFAALKEAWTLDAVNNDDESLYDVASTVAFARMLHKIGYKYTGSPYTNVRFWQSLLGQLNGSSGKPDPELPVMDRIYLQCYDGGANNNPAAWASNLGMKVVPLVWVTNDSKPAYGTTPAQARSKFSSWNQQRNALAGGGYWNDYDIEKMKLSYRDYGGVLTSLFP